MTALTNVRSLNVSASAEREISSHTFYFLSCIFPNITSLHFNDMRSDSPAPMWFGKQCKELRRLSCNNSSIHVYFNGSCLDEAENLTELYIDGSTFVWGNGIIVLPWEHRLLMHCKSLIRVSMRNALFKIEHGNDPDRTSTFSPVTQQTLIHFVRNKPTLRWFRSDLSSENIAMLKKERPEVTFVSE